jgi:hypothetical protein
VELKNANGNGKWKMEMTSQVGATVDDVVVFRRRRRRARCKNMATAMAMA